MMYLSVRIESIFKNKRHCEIVVAIWNDPLAILLRILSIVEHYVVSVTSIGHGFIVVRDRYNSLGQFARRSCRAIGAEPLTIMQHNFENNASIKKILPP